MHDNEIHEKFLEVSSVAVTMYALNNVMKLHCIGSLRQWTTKHLTLAIELL